MARTIVTSDGRQITSKKRHLNYCAMIFLLSSQTHARPATTIKQLAGSGAAIGGVPRGGVPGVPGVPGGVGDGVPGGVGGSIGPVGGTGVGVGLPGEVGVGLPGSNELPPKGKIGKKGGIKIVPGLGTEISVGGSGPSGSSAGLSSRASRTLTNCDFLSRYRENSENSWAWANRMRIKFLVNGTKVLAINEAFADFFGRR